MKIEMPQEPTVDRVWTHDLSGKKILEANRNAGGGWVLNSQVWSWLNLLARGAVYTTHPDFAALECYPAPWTTSASGTVRAANNKVVLDPTLQCPPKLTALIVRAVNELAERISSDGTREGEKR